MTFILQIYRLFVNTNLNYRLAKAPVFAITPEGTGRLPPAICYCGASRRLRRRPFLQRTRVGSGQHRERGALCGRPRRPTGTRSREARRGMPSLQNVGYDVAPGRQGTRRPEQVRPRLIAKGRQRHW